MWGDLLSDSVLTPVVVELGVGETEGNAGAFARYKAALFSRLSLKTIRAGLPWASVLSPIAESAVSLCSPLQPAGRSDVGLFAKEKSVWAEFISWATC